MPRPAGRTNDEYKVARMRSELMAHRQRLRDQGHDPDFIGVTEVAKVCCSGCGKPIPWKQLRGWQD
jgi:hypothetical protein